VTRGLLRSASRHIAIEVVKHATRHAVRSLRRDVGVSVTILLSFCVGIGANVSTFGVLDRVLFQAPPGVKDPKTVHRILSQERVWGGPLVVNSVFTTADWQQFAAVAGSQNQVEGFTVSSPKVLDREKGLVVMAHVTPGLFGLLGVQPIRGRGFSADDFLADAGRAAIISGDLWQRVYGADPAIIGKRIFADTSSYTVIGVAPRGFTGVDLDRVDLWTPREAAPRSGEGRGVVTTGRSLTLLLRVRDGGPSVGLVQSLTHYYRRAHRTDSWFDTTATLISAPLLQARGPDPLRPIRARSVAFAKRLSWIALIVLVVSMANVASLLLMRTVRRRHDLAVRVALGISRRRLLAELFAETAILALVASIAAGLIGAWAGRLLRSMLLFDVQWSASGLGLRPLMMAIGLGLTMAFAAGAVPIAVVMRHDLSGLLKSDARSGDAGGKTRSALITIQTALCFALLGLAAAFLQTMRRSSQTGLGFDPAVLITADLTGLRARKESVDELMGRIRGLPDVLAVANGSADLRPGSQRGTFAIRGQPPIAAELVPSFNAVDGGYFTVAGLTVVQGQGLTDLENSASRPVVVINETMRKLFWPREDPIGACVFVLGDISNCRIVIGFARDVRWNVSDVTVPNYFLPLSQTGFGYGLNLVVRMRDSSRASTIGQIERLIQSTFGKRPGLRAQRVTDRLEPYTRPWRAAALLFAIFGCLAILSAAVGIFGLISYDVVQRARELGIRRALGANTRTLVASVVRAPSRAISIGLASGTVLALASGPIIGTFLFDTSTRDPVLLMGVAAIIISAAGAACAIPAWRAARIDPIIAMRNE
jgi:predicted permease